MSAALSLFARAHDPEIDEAIKRLDALPLSSTGHGSAVPWPVVDKKIYKDHFSNIELNQAIENAPVRVIPLKDLHAIQHSVKPRQVANYIKHPNQIPQGQRHPEHGGLVDIPIVMQYKNRRYIHDGHHRLTAAHLMGERHHVARLVNLDTMVKV